MRKTRRVLVILSALAGSALSLGVVAVGCSSGDTTGSTSEAGADGTVTDTGAGHDTGAGTDTGTDSRAQTDTGMADARRDVGTQEAGDAGLDVQNIPSDAAPDSAAMLAFSGQVAAAVCERFASCCFPGGDASAFDTAACIASYNGFGYAGSGAGYEWVQPDNAAFDPVQAKSCLDQIKAIDCSTNLRTSQQEQAIIAACFGALSGKLQAGTACKAAIQCAPGLFCDITDGGTTGACTALRTTGQGCGDFVSGAITSTALSASQTACSYRGSGNTGLSCQNSDMTGVPFPNAANWKCVQEFGLDASSCNANVDCLSKLCDPGAAFTIYVCATAETFIYPGACQSFLKDGGGD